MKARRAKPTRLPFHLELSSCPQAGRTGFLINTLEEGHTMSGQAGNNFGTGAPKKKPPKKTPQAVTTAAKADPISDIIHKIENFKITDAILRVTELNEDQGESQL